MRAIYQLVYRTPLLVVSWRADDPASLERAVPAALELGQRHPDDLVPVFVERSGRGFDEMLRVVRPAVSKLRASPRAQTP